MKYHEASGKHTQQSVPNDEQVAGENGQTNVEMASDDVMAGQDQGLLSPLDQMIQSGGVRSTCSESGAAPKMISNFTNLLDLICDRILDKRELIFDAEFNREISEQAAISTQHRQPVAAYLTSQTSLATPSLQSQDSLLGGIKGRLTDFIQSVENGFLESLGFQLRGPMGYEIFAQALQAAGLFEILGTSHDKGSLKKLLTLLSLEHVFMNAEQDGQFAGCRKGSMWRMRQSSVFFAHFKAICFKMGSGHYDQLIASCNARGFTQVLAVEEIEALFQHLAMDREASEIIDGMMQSFGMSVPYGGSCNRQMQRLESFETHDYSSFRKTEEFLQQII